MTLTYMNLHIGVNFFENKMVKHGVILVHDYFADNFFLGGGGDLKRQ